MQINRRSVLPVVDVPYYNCELSLVAENIKTPGGKIHKIYTSSITKMKITGIHNNLDFVSGES